MNIPTFYKNNHYTYIEIKIDNLFSNKILLYEKHYESHMKHNNNFVSILGYILRKEAIEVIETTKKHGMPVHSLEKLPEEFLSIQNIEEPMKVSLENNNSNIPNNDNSKLEEVFSD